MKQLKRRLTALELEADPPKFRPYTQIIQEVGEAEDDAIARHEAEHGPLGEDANLIIVQLVAPPARHGEAGPCAA